MSLLDIKFSLHNSDSETDHVLMIFFMFFYIEVRVYIGILKLKKTS